MTAETLSFGQSIGKALDELVVNRLRIVNNKQEDFDSNRRLIERFDILKKLQDVAVEFRSRGFVAEVEESDVPQTIDLESRHPKFKGDTDYVILLCWKLPDDEKSQKLEVRAYGRGNFLDISNGERRESVELAEGFSDEKVILGADEMIKSLLLNSGYAKEVF